jgi:CO/xanthine dehydrogenase Mo-binding subunit
MAVAIPYESVIGQRLPRIEGLAHVTGRTRYVDDIYLPGMLYAAVKMAEYHNARILNIDTTEAEKLPGVVAVVTGRDIPNNRFGFKVQDQPVLADDYVRHLGQPVAAVAATRPDIAWEAVQRIRVDYEPLPPVFDALEAMKPDAPAIHEGGNVEPVGPDLDHRRIRMGDCEAAFKEADVIVEDRLSKSMREHTPMEVHVSVAELDPMGKVVIYSCSQLPHLHQLVLSGILKLPLHKIRLIGGTVGGGFGSKNDICTDHLAAILALKTGRPVKWLFTREQEFLLSTSDQAYPLIVMKSGVKRDGTIIARQVYAVQDTGAFCVFGSAGVDKFSWYVRGPYAIPNYWFDGYCVYTDKAASGAMRGFNVADAIFACEVHTDHIAEVLGMDPLELRRKNLAYEGFISTTFTEMHDVRTKEVLEAAALAFGYERVREAKRSGLYPGVELPPSKRRGVGICLGYQGTGSTGGKDPAMAEVSVNADGTVILRVGSPDIGCGQKTVLAQICAEELGVPLSAITVVAGDTEATPYSFGTAGNRVTHHDGNAVRRAAAEAKQLLCEVAAEDLGLRAEDLDIRGGVVFVKDAPTEWQAPVAQVAAKAILEKGRILVGRGYYMPEAGPVDVEGRGKVTEQYVFACCMAEVEVDLRTGQVDVLRTVLCHDVGRAINPLLCEGQMDGGMAFGIGMALMEDLYPRYPSAEEVARSLHDYKIPTAADMPPDHTNVVLEFPGKTGPWGAKAVGEFTSNTQAAAIINAIHDACGVWVFDLPARPERVLRALEDENKGLTGRSEVTWNR